MKIILAGYNIDVSLLEKLPLTHDTTTPETLSAAYARISRDPRPVDELRKVAIEDVSKARKSNKNIIFGLGHSSVAEHAVFNFDIIDISRLAVEAIESHRLNSYTEKSQRYIKLNRDFILPKEIEEAGLMEEFTATVTRQFSIYDDLYQRLLPYFLDKYPEAKKYKSEARRIDGLAKEDARYALPMAVTSQLGMTVNARNLEYLISHLAGSELDEARTIAKDLYEQSIKIAPSLIKYVEAGPVRAKKKTRINADTITKASQDAINQAEEPVKLLRYDTDGETAVISALLASEGISCAAAPESARRMDAVQRRYFFMQHLKGLKLWDRLPREFELADFTFELIVSSSCFAQLKRHRMATVISYNYDTSLGITIPDSIRETGLEDMLVKSAEDAEKLSAKIKDASSAAAGYALINAHRRKVILKMNARELYHFSRLREDEHSQWDIRFIAKMMMERVRGLMPGLFLLACGKDKFQQLYDSIYSGKQLL